MKLIGSRKLLKSNGNPLSEIEKRENRMTGKIRMDSSPSQIDSFSFSFINSSLFSLHYSLSSLLFFLFQSHHLSTTGDIHSFFHFFRVLLSLLLYVTLLCLFSHSLFPFLFIENRKNLKILYHENKPSFLQPTFDWYFCYFSLIP